MLLKNCCCCCNLKYGYFAYGILSMAARLIACVSLYHASKIVVSTPISGNYRDPHTATYEIIMSQAISIYGGWVITSAVCLFFTLKGIVQDRPILIYPYIVILVVELIGLLVSGILSAIFATAYYLIFLPFVAAILIYELWSLISLYKHMKSNEKIPYMGDLTLLKTV